ncbi:DNA-3-methyladenine glycosylase 2 [Cronobacter dublinensis]|uniref:DNA-3-methyladenine glycosylase 2 n=1 Tax=Cronobacter dublinensis TaxID=413497 RepID=UPI001D238323|nr:DNA-3-methyladenine glycosylase 2 [Cronobacter dublinensis]EGT4378201.1 DNA-3-methyladenine glycosylase 2 [Cronobacter dublinensis]ELY4438278.1 DNA-3-methyladenine glycosylase 2 [Cronobacter dublinensis]MDI7395556.1 DNA-3-methyladenine glycosylase 2 [Cronobacter dublinensis]
MFTLRYQPPYDWTWMLRFLGDRAVAGIEEVSETRYRRTLAIGAHQGWLSVTPHPEDATLALTLSDELLPVADEVQARVASLFDLRFDPAPMLETLGPLAAARPGLRLPGSVDVFEQGVRAILGQLVSVAMAAKLTGKVVQAIGTPLEDGSGWRFPTPEEMARAEPAALKALGMPLMRAGALIQLAHEHLDGRFPLTCPQDVAAGVKALTQLRGIGTWTANYFAMRGWQATDVFLPDDYLIKQRFAPMTPAQIRRYAERWQPWRTYALLHIWYASDWQTPVSE